VIEARGLSKSFGGRAAIDDVSFRVEVGEIVGFLGPNGAGKSTTMRILLGTLRADAGEATVDGPTGYLPESFAAYDALSVRSYLRFIAKLKNVRDDQAVDRAMDRSGVADLASRPVERLSKGQRQRVGMAQALLGSPRAYILDEPTIGLDPAQIVEARRVIAGLREGAAVLLSTHVLSEAAEVCDRVVVIVRGRVVSEERPGSTPDLEDRFMRLVGEAELEQ
jgi:ABC-2 type transport system ATP-binding protein